MQLALGRTGRARIQRHDALPALAHEEEREPDRDLELGPEVVVEDEVVEQLDASPRRPQLGIARAHREARLAGAQDAAIDEVQEVPVLGIDAHAAEIAVVVGVRRRGGRRRRARLRQAAQAANRRWRTARHQASATS